MTPRPDAWPRDEATTQVVDALESICHRLSLDGSSGEVLRRARQAFDRSEWVERPALLGALETAGAAKGLSFTRLTLSAAQAFESAPPPFALATSNGQREPCLVVLDRSRARVQVMGHGWLGRAAFVRLAGEGDGLTATCAAPLAPLAALARGGLEKGLPSRVWALLDLERDDLAVVLVYAVAVGLLSLATPIAVQAVVGSVANAGLAQPLVVLSLLLFAALGLAALLRSLQARVVELLERRLFVRIAIDFAHRFIRLAPDQRQERFGPHVANRFFEVVTLQKTASTLLIDGVAVALQAGTGLLLMAFYHPYLLAFGIALLACVAALALVPWRRGISTAYDESSAKYAVAEWLEELARVPQAFEGYAGARWATEQTEARVRSWLRARSAHFSVAFGQLAGALALHAVASTVLLVVGGALVMKNELTLGQLVAAELVVTSVTDALVKLGKLLDKGYDFATAVEKVGGVVDLPLEETSTGERLPGGTAGKRIEVVAAQVAGCPPLTFSIAPGARRAVIEPEGTVRHRLAQVLAGHDLPDAGVVELDGVDTRRADTLELRGRVALVRPGGVFEGTLFENVAVGLPGASSEQVRSALSRAGLLELVRALPRGLDTPLSAMGHPLSPDQQAQVLVARAIVRKPRLVVVDDFFDALSPIARDACVRALVDAQEHTLIGVCSDPRSALAQRCARVEAGR